jgi:hypothetical protein
MVAAQELGLAGKLFPVAWADRESDLPTAERAKLQPSGLAMLFQKTTANGTEGARTDSKERDKPQMDPPLLRYGATGIDVRG